MIILLQSVTIQFRRLFWHISYYKVRQSNFITKCDRLLLQSASGITKCDRLLLQRASGITKCDRLYYKFAFSKILEKCRGHFQLPGFFFRSI